MMVMHAMFFDIHEGFPGVNDNSATGFSHSELLHADGTLLVLDNADSLAALLHAIERESAYYGSRLNKAKCNCIDMHRVINTFLQIAQLWGTESSEYPG